MYCKLHRSLLTTAATTLLACSLVAPAADAQCEPQWSAAFGGPYPDGVVRAILRHDDGAGDSYFVGGDFTQIGESGAVHIARWDGNAWWALGAGVNGPVHTMAVLDEDGPGPARPVLYVGGDFTQAGGVPAAGLAKWDGLDWSAVGDGFAGSVRALQAVHGVHERALYVGGRALSLHGNTLGTVAQWTTHSWTGLGDALGPDGQVLALAWHDHALFAGGEAIEGTGGDLPFHLARLQDEQWNAVPGALDNGADRAKVAALASAGSTLYVGGDFTAIAGIAITGAAAWQDGIWSAAPLLSGLRTRCIGVRDRPSGRTVLFGGRLLSNDPQETRGTVQTIRDPGPSSQISGYDGEILALAHQPSGAYFVGGSFERLGIWPAPHFHAQFTFEQPMGHGVWAQRLDGFMVGDLQDGAGPAIHLFGSNMGNLSLGNGPLLRWHGGNWSLIPAMSHPTLPSSVTAGALFDVDGPGPQPPLLVAAFGDGLGWIRQWTGDTWVDLRPTTSAIRVMRVLDAGAGPALYLGAQGPATFLPSPLAVWDGQTWSTIPQIVGAVDTLDYIGADPSHNLAAGLYVGGRFPTVGPGLDPIEVNNVARWSGTSWSPLGEGLVADASYVMPVRDMILFDDGTGPQLYVTGGFTSAGGESIAGIARWNGSQWSQVGGSLTFATNGYAPGGHALAVFDDGSGLALFVAGEFTEAGGVPAQNIAKWNGQAWQALNLGVNATVTCLTVFDEDGPGPRLPALYLGGAFSSAGGEPSYGIARWGQPVPIPRTDPLDTTVRSGATARLHASAPGGINGAGGQLHHQWRHNGSPLTNEGPISGAHTQYLVISPARQQHAGLYDLVVANGCGQTTTAAATLTVLCHADWDGNGTVESADVAAFLTSWLASLAAGTPDADFDHSGRVDSLDLSAFITHWLDAIRSGC